MFSSYLYVTGVKSEYLHKWSTLYSVNVHRALSFGTVVMPSPSGLSVVIKLMIKQMNGDTCIVGALQRGTTLAGAIEAKRDDHIEESLD